MKPSKAEGRRIRRRIRARASLPRLATKYRFVDHSRYGDQPIRSRKNFSLDEVHPAFWQYSPSSYDRRIIFAETAIRAEVWKQNYCCFPRRLYVDIARSCRKCGRWFIFFALEQKYLFESLGFYVDADCVHCQECRHTELELKQRIERYSALLEQTEKSAIEWQELADVADILWASGYIKKAGTLQKSRIPKRLKEFQ